jgi:hypothetical protein
LLKLSLNYIYCSVFKNINLKILLGFRFSQCTAFWIVTPSSRKKALCVGGTYHVNLHGRRISRGRNQQKKVIGEPWTTGLSLKTVLK